MTLFSVLEMQCSYSKSMVDVMDYLCIIDQYWSAPAGPAPRSPCVWGTGTGFRFRSPRARRWWRRRWRTAVLGPDREWRSSPSKPSRTYWPRTGPSEPPPHAEEPTESHRERRRARHTPRADSSSSYWPKPATDHCNDSLSTTRMITEA